MMNRILVPLDGSLLAEHALAVAAKLARSTGGTLILVQALAMPVEYGSPLVPQVVPLANEEQERQSQAYLTQKASLPMLCGLPSETAVLSEAPALAILNAAIDYQADMIVMTSHGRTGISRWVFGSVAEHVVRQAQVPVLVLRQHQLPFWIEGAELVEAPKTPGRIPSPSYASWYPWTAHRWLKARWSLLPVAPRPSSEGWNRLADVRKDPLSVSFISC
jgi:nucleotide-binding universal stress UspA family protein